MDQKFSPIKKERPASTAYQGRRQFLQTAVIGSVGALSLGGMRPKEELSRMEKGLPSWVARARNQIPALRESHYFQTGAYGPSPQPVLEKMKSLLDLQNRGPADPRYLKTMKEAEDSCRPLLAQNFGATPEEIALTHNTTSGLNTVLWSIDWKPGDELIISDEEHPALLLPTYNLKDRFGIQYKTIALDNREAVVDQVISRLSPKTRLVAMSHVSRSSGRTVPARELADALHQRGVRLLLDGAQGPGNVPLQFHDLGCDYYAMCGHKWLLGPKGTGALFIRKEILETTAVSWTGSRAQSAFGYEGNFTWKPDARRFEFATRDLAKFGGFAHALEWLHALGWDQIHQRISELTGYASASVKANPKFELVSPQSDALRNGILVLKMPPGNNARELYDRLGQDDQMLVSPVRDPENLRICIHFFNTKDEINAVLNRIDHYCA